MDVLSQSEIDNLLKKLLADSSVLPNSQEAKPEPEKTENVQPKLLFV